MARLPKKYIKKYGGINKRAWAAFKRKALSGKKKSAVKKKSVAKKVSRKPAKKTIIRTIKIGAVKMAKKRKYTKKRKYRRLGQARRFRLVTGKTMNALVDGAVVGGSAIGSTWVLNMIPWIKDQTSWMKALIQAGIGAVGVGMVRNPWGKKAMAGMIAGGAISLAMPFMPEGFKFSGGRAFSANELQELQTMGVPYSIPGASTRIGVPYSIPGASSQASMSRGRSRRTSY
jgi:hypothetical protein